MVGVAAVLAMLLASLAEPLPVAHLQHLDWQRGGCPARCRPEWCLAPALLLHCPAGRVREPCGCCWECGNGEGQLCDPEALSGPGFYGRCAEGLRCRAPRRDPPGDAARPTCVCARQEVVCGNDGKTYENVCQLRAAQHRLGERHRLAVAQHGPCKARPVISYAPRDISAPEGSDVIFSCEVSSYPLASIRWSKEGDSIFLPADDSSMAVQARGGPRRYELTGWLQIQGVRADDEGMYTCAARNAFGEVSASARLQVAGKGSQLAKELRQQKKGVYQISDDEEGAEDDEDYEGQPSGFMYL